MAYYVTTKSLKLSINYNNQNLGRVRSFPLITLRSRSCLFVLKNYVTMTVKWSQIIVNLSSKLWTMMKILDLVSFIFYSKLSDCCRFQCNRFTMFSYCRLYWMPISVEVYVPLGLLVKESCYIGHSVDWVSNVIRFLLRFEIGWEV